ncbi:MAG: hypothetical protein ABS942_17380 [Solibacillus sp.]
MIKFASYGNEREVALNAMEIDFTKLVFETLKDSSVLTDKLEIVRKSDSYATMVIRGKEWDFDLIRIKITDKTKWLSLSLSKNDRKVFESSPLFEAQKKKSQLHWKSKIQKVNDISQYKDLIINSYLECIELNPTNFLQS